MTGRPKEFEREVALKGAMETFWKQGYEATSVSDLVEATGINRGSMYDTFGSKYDLYLEALREYAENSTDQLSQILNSDRGSGLENLRSFFDYIEEKLYSGEVCLGCMVLNAAVELGPQNAEITSLVKKVSADQKKLISMALGSVEADQQGSYSSSNDQLAEFTMNHLRGLIVSAKSGASRETVRNNIEFLFQILESQKNNNLILNRP